LEWGKNRFSLPTFEIQQGDPLSPYLFVLCFERLNSIIVDFITQGKRRLAKIWCNGLKLSNHFFDDDIVLFVEASIEQAPIIQEHLESFRASFSQKVNLEKSRIFS